MGDDVGQACIPVDVGVRVFVGPHRLPGPVRDIGVLLGIEVNGPAQGVVGQGFGV